MIFFLPVAMRAHRVNEALRVQEESVMHATDHFFQRAFEQQRLEYIGLIAVLHVFDAQLKAVVQTEADDDVRVFEFEKGAVGRRPNVFDLLETRQLFAFAEAN